jgi:hypothetical protein
LGQAYSAELLVAQDDQMMRLERVANPVRVPACKGLAQIDMAVFGAESAGPRPDSELLSIEGRWRNFGLRRVDFGNSVHALQ